MTQNQKDILEILKVVAAFLTPIIVLVWGFIINRRVETNKMSVLKEKEFQVKWAELFLNLAIEYNKNITEIIMCLNSLQETKTQKEHEDIFIKLKQYIAVISKAEWDMQNYSQFAGKYSNDVQQRQKTLSASINKMLKEKYIDFEILRVDQFEYNKAVRKVHNEILKSIA